MDIPEVHTPLPSPQSPARLFTPRFFVMCGYTFTVFLSAFQLFPTAPFRILDLGGTKFAAGLFLGFLTYASAFSAPITGGIADKIGKRKMLILCSAVLTLFSVAYGFSPNYQIPLLLVTFHGIFWSGLLSASSAYLTEVIPPSRRAEGIAYWGMSTVFAIAIAPNLGLWIYQFGWGWLCASIGFLNLIMVGIALHLEETDQPRTPLRREHLRMKDLVEWRVLILSATLFLYSFGYGGITSFSAMYAKANGVAPSGIYFTTLAIVILVTRPFSGPLADRIGHRKVLIPCLVLIFAGMGVLALGGGIGFLVISAIVFGTGFGTAYPVFAAHVIHTVDPARRGAVFGSILAAFDTGIGSGSIITGWLIEHFGFAVAFGFAACLAGLSLPYYLIAERHLFRPEMAAGRSASLPAPAGSDS